MSSDNGSMPTILVLGIGNTVMSDDGVGVKVVQLLQDEYRFPDHVEVLDGGTLGLDLLPKLEGISHLIMVDAVETGDKPGTCVRLSGEDLPIALETKISPHQMGLKDLLAVARLLDHAPDEMTFELTPAVASQVEAMKGAVLRELEALGVAAVRG